MCHIIFAGKKSLFRDLPVVWSHNGAIGDGVKTGYNDAKDVVGIYKWKLRRLELWMVFYGRCDERRALIRPVPSGNMRVGTARIDRIDGRAYFGLLALENLLHAPGKPAGRNFLRLKSKYH